MDGFGRSKKVSYHPMLAVYISLLNIPSYLRRTAIVSKFHSVIKESKTEEGVRWTEFYKNLADEFEPLQHGFFTYSAYLDREVTTF